MSLPLLSSRITTAKLICAFGLTTRLFFSLFSFVSPTLCAIPYFHFTLVLSVNLPVNGKHPFVSLTTNWKIRELREHEKKKKNLQSRSPYMRFLNFIVRVFFLALSTSTSSKVARISRGELGQDRSWRLRFRRDAYFRTRSSVNSDFANGEEISSSPYRASASILGEYSIRKWIQEKRRREVGD